MGPKRFQSQNKIKNISKHEIENSGNFMPEYFVINQVYLKR